MSQELGTALSVELVNEKSLGTTTGFLAPLRWVPDEYVYLAVDGEVKDIRGCSSGH